MQLSIGVSTERPHGTIGAWTPLEELGPWDEADLGVNDTRYEGLWDTEHAIWPAEYAAGGQARGCANCPRW